MKLKSAVPLLLMGLAVAMPPDLAAQASKTRSSKTKTTKTAVSKTKKLKAAAPKKSVDAKAPRTSAEAKRRQEDTQKEIKLTEKQIQENDLKIKRGLSDLAAINAQVSDSKAKIAATHRKIQEINSNIAGLESQIQENRDQLQTLREQYLKAVNNMRVNRKGQSTLAFIFSARNFSQALRRARYLRQFSDWKEKQSALIADKSARLAADHAALAQAKVSEDRTLRLQRVQEDSLRVRQGRQDAVIADLRSNGAALKGHLARKQEEANRLRNQISALIAEEQRRAEEAERARKAEEQRRAKEQRRAEEAEKAREAERQRLAMAAEEGKKQETAPKGKEKPAAKDKKADKAAKDKKTAGDNEKFAQARKRTPRSESPAPANSTATAKSSATASNTASASGFAAMRGKLPRPVSGPFRVTSPFGRQSLPDLPDVKYDNPGIDVAVSAGAPVQAVYAGKVSGVYMLPGFHTVVIVNHGGYYTVYGNIGTASVKVGDQVKAGQRLGTVAPDEGNGGGSLHFEVWKNREKLNPADWLG